MAFSICRFRMNIITLAFSVIVLLSFQTNVGLACETQHKSVKVLSVNSEKFPPVYDVAVKRIWVQKNTALKKTRPAKDYVIHAKIKNVISDYKTGMTDSKKDQISQYILKQSRRYGYDPLFLTALIITESSFNHRAKSKVGALGLMQIRPRTGKAMASESNIRWRGTRTLYRPEKNIALGTYYLSKMLNRFGNMKTALEAYNHGPTRTARHLRRGKRTHKYSGKVFAIYNKIKLVNVVL
jgi:soluble lytic murein transglycosylase-like protein